MLHERKEQGNYTYNSKPAAHNNIAFHPVLHGSLVLAYHYNIIDYTISNNRFDIDLCNVC
jgi:hypothetical protein